MIPKQPNSNEKEETKTPLNLRKKETEESGRQ
jgi:hypothetical protein